MKYNSGVQLDPDGGVMLPKIVSRNSKLLAMARSVRGRGVRKLKIKVRDHKFTLRLRSGQGDQPVLW